MTSTATNSLSPGQKITCPSGKYYMIFQTDGDAAVYQTSSTTKLWTAGSGGQSANRLIIQPDGNVVIYNNTTAIWNAGSQNSGSGNRRLTILNNGALMIYDGTGNVTWSTSAVPASIIEGFDNSDQGSPFLTILCIILMGLVIYYLYTKHCNK